MRLHRYLFNQYLQVTVMVLASLLMVVWLNQTLQLLELVVNKGSPLFSFLALTILATPLWLLQAIPIAVFIAVMWVVNKINSDRELLAMQSVGWNMRQFAIAPVLFGLLCTAFLIFNSVVLLPTSFGAFKERQLALRTAIPKVLLQDKVFVDLAPNLTIFIDERVSRQQVRNVFIQDKRNNDDITTLTALKGTFSSENGRAYLTLEQGERSQISQAGEASATLFFDKYKLNISHNATAPSGRRAIDMNEDSITNLLDPSKASHPKYIAQRLAYAHYRITSPFLAITLVLIAVAGLTRGRLRDEYITRRIWGTILTAIIIQILFISARSVTVNVPVLWPLQYLMIIVPSAVASYLILAPKEGVFKKWRLVKS